VLVSHVVSVLLAFGQLAAVVDKIVWRECVGYRSNNFIIGLTNNRPGPHAHSLWNYTLCGQYPGCVPAGATVNVRCTHTYIRQLRFRYVIVQFPLINDMMNFCELEIFALGETIWWKF